MDAPNASANISIIVARAQNGVIGKDGTLPWHLSADLKRFKRITMGKAILMGRLTHISIGRKLPGRRNIVLSRHRDTKLAAGCEHARDLEHALHLAGTDELMVIGGAGVYQQVLDADLAQRIHLTEVLAKCEGDTEFPALDTNQWQRIQSPPPTMHPADENNQYPMQFVSYIRSGQSSQNGQDG